MNINNVKYFVTQSGDGYPLMLLHGFTGSSLNWERHTEVFAAHFRVIAPDLLGHGKTDSPDSPDRYQIEQAAADLIGICDALEIDQFALLGYSMGGRLALYTALKYPERVKILMLESASPGLKTPEERAARRQSDEALADQIEQEGIAAFVDKWEKLPLFATQARLPQSEKDRLRTQRLQNNPRGLANSLRGMGTGAQPSLWDELREIRQPVLLLCGNLDAKFTQIASQMHSSLQNSTLYVVDQAGHTIHLEQPQVLDQQIMEFMLR